MTINEFIEALNRLGVSGDQQLCVHSFGGIGGSGREIRSVSKGFDWNQGKIIIHTTHALMMMPSQTAGKSKRKAGEA